MLHYQRNYNWIWIKVGFEDTLVYDRRIAGAKRARIDHEFREVVNHRPGHKSHYDS